MQTSIYGHDFSYLIKIPYCCSSKLAAIICNIDFAMSLQ